MAVGIAPVTYLIASQLHLGGDSAADLHAILPVLVRALPAVAVLTLQAEFFKGIGRPATGTFVQSVFVPLAMLVGSVALWWLNAGTFEHIILLYLAATFLAWCSCSWLGFGTYLAFGANREN
jgi:hypothetical protein